jgi:hypothetical protein
MVLSPFNSDEITLGTAQAPIRRRLCRGEPFILPRRP